MIYIKQKLITLFLVVTLLSFNKVQVAAAASVSYPIQKFRLAIYNTNQNINASGNNLTASTQNGKAEEKWSVNYVSSGIFEIVSSSSNKILTANGSGVTLAADSNGSNQRWKIEGVQKDYDGYYLYYKITSSADASKSLTYTNGSGFSLTKYSGNNYQKFKINLDGLEGFAANCKTNSGEKAGTIGGLLGETVFVSTADQLEAELKTTVPKTVVVTANIDMKNKSHTRIRDNKTIVGSFSKHTIYDSMFRTNNEYGNAGDEPSDNIVFRNLDLQAKNVKDRILINIWSSRQIWIDHINFNSQLSYNRNGNGQDEVGKFIWINTPYESYLDKKDRNRSPDYVTVSYCKFTNRYWTVAYGTQNTEISRDRTTLLYNWWNQNVRRCPQLGNGSAHVYNNYYSAYGVNNNGSATTGIIGGDGSNMVSQNNRFQGYSAGQALVMGSDPSRDDNSYLATEVNGTPSRINFSPKSKSSWYPNQSNYGYELLDSYNTKGTDTKSFCTKYAGAFTSESGIKYITDSDFSSWITTKYESPFLTKINTVNNNSSSNSNSNSSSGSSGSSSGSSTIAKTALLNDGSTYMIKNANSNLYIDIDGAKAANGANAQQWGASSAGSQNIFKLISAGDGYYYIVSAVGDGGSYVLDVSGAKNTNGANIHIYKYNGNDNQKFMFSKNSNGTYKILTKVSGGKSAIEIKDGSTSSGANVQQWVVNGASCQDWYLEPVSNPGCSMNTSYTYTFQNGNSGMVMDIVSGKMADNTNVQQWGRSDVKSQKWKLVAFGSGNYYYIRSASNMSYALRAEGSGNGANIDIKTFSRNDSSMLFRFSKNPDGTYHIITHASKDQAYVEIASASKSSGANVQQWAPTNNNCQTWKAITE